MSDVKLSGPHTDLPAPNCDGLWGCVNTRGNPCCWCNVEMVDGTPYHKGYGDKIVCQPGDRWTLYVPADSVSIELEGEKAAARGWEQLAETRLADIKRLRAELDSLKERQTPAVPAARPAPDREDGSYTKPAWSGWWSRTKGTAHYMTVTDGKAYYGGGAQTIVSGWRPAPIADPAEVELLKAELAKTESQRDRSIQIADERNKEASRLAAERDALSAKLAECRQQLAESEHEVKAKRDEANEYWENCRQALRDAGIPSGDAICNQIKFLAKQRDEARDALEAERAKSVEPETPSRGYEPGSADAIAEDFEVFCVGRRRYEIDSLTDRIAAASSMAIRLREADSEF